MHFWFICFLFLFFVYLPPRFKVWIELLNLSDSLKYFIPSEPIWLSIPNIYSRKGLEKIELKNILIIIYNIFSIIFWFTLFLFLFFVFCFIYSKDPKFGLNCWIRLIHLNISFLLSQFDCLLETVIQKKKRIRKNGIDKRYFR